MALIQQKPNAYHQAFIETVEELIGVSLHLVPSVELIAILGQIIGRLATLPGARMPATALEELIAVNVNFGLTVQMPPDVNATEGNLH